MRQRLGTVLQPHYGGMQPAEARKVRQRFIGKMVALVKHIDAFFRW